jgi:hypothetical protein
MVKEPTLGISTAICEPVAGLVRQESEKTRLRAEADQTEAWIAARAVAVTCGALLPAIQVSIFLLKQCCGSWILIFVNAGSRIQKQQQKRGEKKKFSTFYCDHKYHKI